MQTGRHAHGIRLTANNYANTDQDATAAREDEDAYQDADAEG